MLCTGTHTDGNEEERKNKLKLYIDRMKNTCYIYYDRCTTTVVATTDEATSDIVTTDVVQKKTE